MSFRKRNVVLQQGTIGNDSAAQPSHSGQRPSPLTGHATTSTGTLSLDNLLGGHNGLVLGSSVLIEENGTTDFAGSLLRFFATQGLVHGHTVHVVGAGEQWVKSLPGVVGPADKSAESKPLATAGRTKVDQEKMKIAWRYERLGQVDSSKAEPATLDESSPFCHAFDLAKRLTIGPGMIINHYAIDTLASNPFQTILARLSQAITLSAPQSTHRVVIPSLLSPALYSPLAASPETFLAFLHALRAMLRQYSGRMIVMSSIPLGLYPRTTGLIRWAEIISDGVLELAPFPHLMDASNNVTADSTSNDEQPQGMVKLHKLPLTTERGGRGLGITVGDDLAFTLSRRRFVIKPFSLPPIEGDSEAQQGETGSNMPKKQDMEF